LGSIVGAVHTCRLVPDICARQVASTFTTQQTDAKEKKIWKAGMQELTEPDSTSFEILSCFPASFPSSARNRNADSA
jgi:hypothetical protein